MLVNTLRTPRRNGKNGILKIELRTMADKIMLLKNKTRLKQTHGFERVFVRSSKTHLERLMDLNFRTVLAEIPQGNSYEITGNGRLVKQNEHYAQSVRSSNSHKNPHHEAATSDVRAPGYGSPHDGSTPKNLGLGGQPPASHGVYHKAPSATHKTPPTLNHRSALNNMDSSVHASNQIPRAATQDQPYGIFRAPSVTHKTPPYSETWIHIEQHG